MSDRSFAAADSPASSAANSGSSAELRSLIAVLEREAKALGDDPLAGVLFGYVGRLWEQSLAHPKSAAIAYQRAVQLAPQLVDNLRSARKLFSEVGNWSMTLQLLDAELDVQSDPASRAMLLAEKAAILDERLSRETEAKGIYEQCLALDPQDIFLLCQLQSTFSRKGNWQALVRVYELLAKASQDDELRAQSLCAAGFTAAFRLSDERRAAELFRAALSFDRRDAALVSASVQNAERGQALEPLVSALLAQIELEGPGAAATFLRISKLYERLHRTDDAIATLLAARRAIPADPLILAELARIYEGEGRQEELAQALTEWSELVGDESEFVSLNLWLASLYEEDLKRDGDAVGRYQAILARSPGHAVALAGLGRLHYRNQQWPALVEVFDAEIAAAADPKVQVAKLFKSAEVVLTHLGRTEEATRRYARCLEIEPGYLPAQKALARLYETQGKYAELIALYEQDLLQPTGSEQLISTLKKIGRVYEERLNDLPRAADTLKRILDAEPEHLPTLQDLEGLYASLGQWGKFVDVLQTEAAIITDVKEVLKLHHRIAETLEEQLLDRGRAVAEYEKLLFLAPSYLPALKALGRLYAQDQRWEDLIRMHRAEAEISPSPDLAADLIYRIGELYEQRLGDLDKAIPAYQEVLTLAPSHGRALRALARIYRAQGAWEELISVLRAGAAARTDPIERANALFEAAVIWEDQLVKPQTAIEGYEEVLRLRPEHAAATRALERLYAANNDARQLIALLEREARVSEASRTKIAAYLKIAHWYFDGLGDAARAAQACESALAIDSAHLPALALLERTRLGDRARRLEAQERLAGAVGDEGFKQALRLQTLEENRAPSPAALRELKEWFFEHPSDSGGARHFERLLEKTQDSRGLLDWWQRQRAGVKSPLERLAMSLRIAIQAEQTPGEDDLALSAYRDAAKEDARCTAALRGIHRLALKRGDYAQALDALEKEGFAARDPEVRLEALVAAGLLAGEHLNDPRRALSNFHQALDIEPLEPRANTAAETLLSATGDKSAACGFFRRRAGARLAKRDLAGAADDLCSAAQLLWDDLDDPVEAYRLLANALSAVPHHLRALELQAKLASQLGQFEEAVAALSARIRLGGEAATILQLHLKLGSIFQDKLGDTSRALAHLQTALAMDIGNTEVLSRLAGIHTSSRNWTAACDCLERLMNAEPDPELKAGYAVRLAQILDSGLSNGMRAATVYRLAYETAPDSKAVLDAYVEFCQRHSRPAELIELLERQAMKSERPQATEAKLRIAELTARSGGPVAQAVLAYRRVLELDPSNIQAHAGIADVLESSSELLSAVEAHRRVLSLQLGRIESWHGLFHIWRTTHQNDRAFCIAALLIPFGQANAAEKRFYEEQQQQVSSTPSGFLDHQTIQGLLDPLLRGNPLVAVIQAIGDQLTKLFPPQSELFGVNRKTDRLSASHPSARLVLEPARLLSPDEFEVYEADEGALTLDVGSPLAVYVGPDFSRKWTVPQRMFLAGRAAFGLAFKTAVFRRTSSAELADLIGNSIRIFAPGFGLVGRRNDDRTKQLRKVYSRKALKALEMACKTSAKSVDLSATVEGLKGSADRFGVVVTPDPSAAVEVLAGEESLYSGDTLSLPDAVAKSAALRKLLLFCLSETYLSLRAKANTGLAQLPSRPVSDSD